MFTSRCTTRFARARRPTLTEQFVRLSSVTLFVFSGSMISRARAEHDTRARKPTFT